MRRVARPAVLLLIVLAVVIASCTGRAQRSKPESSSKPYEVLTVGDKRDLLSRALTADMPDLPQPEPLFDVRDAKTLDDLRRLSRAIVIYDAATDFQQEENVWAEPQIVIRTNGKDGSRLARTLTAFNLREAILSLRRKHNAKAEKTVKDAFGISMLLPADMTGSMVRKDFIWLSNNATRGMQNVVICRGDVRLRLKDNLKGETDDMYVTLPDSLPTAGLWEMRGDAMGGPYMLRRLDGDITVLAFVYAPEMKKRNLMRQLQAVLYTIKKN